ncbi:MAG: queuosine salvage family protein, partial [Acidobacteriota bacterium]
EMPYFNDVENYNGLVVPFYKRAQLTAADLSLAFAGEGIGHFDDLNNITIFADNLVPHVLRVDNVLLYDKSLAARIDAEELISPGSAEEIEIRACAVHAVELLVEALQKTGHKVTAMGLDYLLWNRGQQPYYKKVKPRHRSRTVFY